MKLTLTIPGEPIAQPRAKATAFAGHARVYTPSKNGIATYKAAIRMAAENVFDAAPLDGPVHCELLFVFGRSKGHYGTGRNAGCLKASAPMAHTKKPDCDNLAKAVLDGLNGVVFVDDAAVWSLNVVKRFVAADEKPHTEIKIFS